MIIATKALLDHNPRPSLEEVKKALSRNLCLCTGYVKIFDAVKLASRRLTESFLAPAKQAERNVVVTRNRFAILGQATKTGGRS